MSSRIDKAIREYVKRGGYDAFAFSIEHENEFGDVPGAVI